jgi:hypothetical protein
MGQEIVVGANLGQPGANLGCQPPAAWIKAFQPVPTFSSTFFLERDIYRAERVMRKYFIEKRKKGWKGWHRLYPCGFRLAPFPDEVGTSQDNLRFKQVWR